MINLQIKYQISMLITFAVTNFRSMQARQVFSMLPSTRVKERSFTLLRSKIYEKLLLQPTAVVYGANNAGKSNLLKAVYALKWLVEHSGKFNSVEALEANEFFLLNAQTENQPTTFEIDFIAANQLRYTYLVTFDQEKILSEVLSVYHHTAQGKVTLATLFDRKTGKHIKFGDLLRGRKKDIEAALNHNQLFLSKADNYNQEQLQPVYRFFADELEVIQFDRFSYQKKWSERDPTINALETLAKPNLNHALQTFIEHVLTESQTGVLAFEFVPSTSDPTQKELMTLHKYFDGEKEVGLKKMPLSKQSVGTWLLIGISNVFYRAFTAGKVILVDELDTSMHSLLTKTLVQLFQNTATNPNQAQLIFTTHDSTLLEGEFMGRDQKWMVEKSEAGATELYSLADMNGIRKDTSFENWYLTGRFGGVPNINKKYLFNQIAQQLSNGKNNPQ